MMRFFKCIVAITIACSLISLTACRNTSKFNGYYEDLNIVLHNNVLGLSSRDHNSAIILEEDSEGRRLFAFQGLTHLSGKYLGDERVFWAFLIAQKTEGEYVFYYPDDNVFLFEDTYSYSKDGSFADYLPGLIEEKELADDIRDLKKRNDWGKPFNEQKCANARVSDTTRDKEVEGGLISETAKRQAYLEVAKNGDYYNRNHVGFNYLTSDKYDRHIFYFKTLTESDIFTGSYVVLIDVDGSIDPDTGIMEIEEPYDYQDELKAFKKANDWDSAP